MRSHISLPSLQVAATAFLATTCGAEELYCVDKSTSEVVAAENCEGDVENFANVEGPADTAVGDVLMKRDDDDDDDDSKLRDDLEIVAEFAQRLGQMKLITGGFGQDSCDCRDSSGRGGTGGGAVGRPRGGRGG